MDKTLYKNKYRIKTVRLPWWDYSEDGDYFITIRTHDKGNIFGKIFNDDIALNIRGKIVKKYILEIPDHFGNVILRSWVIMPDHVHFVLRIRNKRKLVDTQHCCVSNSDNINIERECDNGKTQQCCVSNKKDINDKVELKQTDTQQCCVPKDDRVEFIGDEPQQCCGLGKCDMNNECVIKHTDTQRCCVSTREQEKDHHNQKGSKTFYKLKPGSIPVIVRSFKSICTRTIHSIENNKQFKWQRSFYDKVVFNDQVLQNVELYIKSNHKKINDKNKTPILQ